MRAVIIGAGECGVSAAFALRAAGAEGPVLLLGAEAALPYARPPLSKDGAVRAIVAETRFAEAGIDLRCGVAAVAIDRAARRVALSDGTSAAYDRLLLATGAEARGLPGALSLRTDREAAAIRGRLGPGVRLVLVGAGFIGLELAAMARGLGAAVTVVESQPRILSRALLPEIAAVIADRHRAAGVEILTGVQVAGIGPGAVRLEDARRLPADLVVAGIGAVPDTRLAGAAGLALDNGVAVDAMLATSDPAIFAAGDCASLPDPRSGRRVRLESWRVAREMGEHAARNILGAGAAWTGIPWFWSDQYDLGLQVAGLPDPAAPGLRRDIGGGAFLLYQLDGAGRIASVSGIGPGNAVARDVKVSEMMMAKGTRPDPAALMSRDVKLKALLAA